MTRKLNCTTNRKIKRERFNHVIDMAVENFLRSINSRDFDALNQDVYRWKIMDCKLWYMAINGNDSINHKRFVDQEVRDYNHQKRYSKKICGNDPGCSKTSLEYTCGRCRKIKFCSKRCQEVK